MRKLTGDAVTSIFELTIEYDPKPLYSNLGSDTALQDTLQGIKPLKVAVLTPPDLYVPDVSGSIDVLGSIPGSEIFYVWKEKGKCQGILGPELYADTTFEECPPVDVVVIGAVHPNLSKDVGAQDFLLQQEKQGASMIAVCEGALMLGSTGLLKGRHAVTNFHMVNLLRLADAIPSTKEVVVVDGKFYTAGPVMGAYELPSCT
ncbi:DJ-1/PfpI family protein [Pseudovibrio denitrificans]|uniref:DJ-1/PfpI family protein n=1 Tax=Pseudovibrio denitrificans TaxID=258256 RepID=UPI0006CF92D9|nr:DJ-1/PfpI family protein [Pseudovibrio denitrificans]